MTLSSLSRMVTASPYCPQTQAPSQGAGQTRPVNSGKLLVSKRRLRAWKGLSAQIMSFHSGMRLWRGQPKVRPSQSIPAWQ